MFNLKKKFCDTLKILWTESLQLILTLVFNQKDSILHNVEETAILFLLFKRHTVKIDLKTFSNNKSDDILQ